MVVGIAIFYAHFCRFVLIQDGLDTHVLVQTFNTKVCTFKCLFIPSRQCELLQKDSQ